MVTKVNNPVLDLTSPGVDGALFADDVDMGGNRVENVAHPPLGNFEAASKLYVDQVAATAGGGVFLPAGFGPIPWGAQTVIPAGWLLCDGQEYNPATYPDLASALGTVYNTGGETPGWFRVPDMRGTAPAGMDDMTLFGSVLGPAGNMTNFPSGLGNFAGNEEHTLTISEMPAHAHPGSSTTPAANHQHNETTLVACGTGDALGPSIASCAGGHLQAGSNLTGPAGAHSHTLTIGSQGLGSPHNNVQPTRFFGWIIKSDNSTIGFPGQINMGFNKIINLADPTANQDAANKQYVDYRASYDIALYRAGQQFTAGKEVARFPAVRQFTIPLNFGNSTCESRVVATAVSGFTILRNGIPIGTITISGGSGTGTYSAGGPWVFVPGDILTVTETTADTTLEDTGIVIEAMIT